MNIVNIILAGAAIMLQVILSALFLRSLGFHRLTTDPSSDSEIVKSRKAIYSYGGNIILLLLCAGFLAFLTPLAPVIEIGIAGVGIVLGLVVALFRFTHWDEVMAKMEQARRKALQSPHTFNGKTILALLLLSFASHLFSGYIRDIVGTDNFTLVLGVLGIAWLTIVSGYWSEHLILYWIHHTHPYHPDLDGDA